MQESTQVSSSTNPPPETKNTRKLTEEHKKLIVDNLPEFKNNFLTILRGNPKYRCLGKPSRVYNEALSLLPKIALSFIPGKGTMNFPRYAAQIALYRQIDRYRKNNRHTVKNTKEHLIEDIKDKIYKERGHAYQEEILNELQRLGYNKNKVLDNDGWKRVSLDKIADTLIVEDNDLKVLDWHDFKQDILAKAEETFKDDPLYITIIKEYIIPKSENANFKNLIAISKETGINKGKLNKILHSNRMKNFIKMIYLDVE